MSLISKKGRTALVYRVDGGLVFKEPRGELSERTLAEINRAFEVEKQLLTRLGSHSRLVQYHGSTKGGLLLGEAEDGDLQSFLERNSCKIDISLRRKWSLQIAEAVAYVHTRGIIHSNVCPNNVLVHHGSLLLADFGGSRCVELGLDGRLLPDPPFFDPETSDITLPQLDIYSLGMLLYIINTGNYPFCNGIPQADDRYDYEDRVRALLKQGNFPDLVGVPFASVITGCCCERRFKTMEEVVVALASEVERLEE